jgi:hypothetical protein
LQGLDVLASSSSFEARDDTLSSVGFVSPETFSHRINLDFRRTIEHKPPKSCVTTFSIVAKLRVTNVASGLKTQN